MVRTLAISLGSLAMGLVVLRGAISGELAATVAQEAIVILVIYLIIGAIAGAIADYLVRDAVKSLYHKRVEWYREGVARLAEKAGTSSPDETTNTSD